jgi:hypothetical protein
MRLILMAMLATAGLSFGQRSGTGVGHAAGGSGFRASSTPRGPVRYVAPPNVAHVHTGTTVVPYPVFYGGYYYNYDPSLVGNGYAGNGDQAPAPGGDSGNYGGGYNAGYDSGAPGQAPVVIINQSFRPDGVNPVLRDYSNTPLPPPDGPQGMPPGMMRDDEPTVYLIAMKDHTIFPAVAYWVEGDTLNYITTEGSQNRASLALVDRDFSAQLNRERHVEFKLPAPK